MRRLAIALAGGLLAAVPAAATASTGGGRYISPAAEIASISCRTDCADERTARPGSLLRVKGRSMRRVATVTFLGGRGNADDVTVPVAEATPHSVVVRVPADAAPGRLRTRNHDGSPSAPSTATILIAGVSADDLDEPPTPQVADRDTSPRLDGYVEASTVYSGGARRATLRYSVVGPEPVDVAVDLVRRSDGALVQRWLPGMVAPGVEQRVEWNGAAPTGETLPAGRYEFRVFSLSAAAAQAAQGGEPPMVADSFLFLDHKFPVRGRHDYGESAARFGAGRGGRSHQGQDVFAACGTPLVAARGGVVRYKAYHGAAGNYVVIDGDGTDLDYVYMHLQAPALVDRGDRVATGQRIGAVGATGRASGCHLHLELWTAPGWYEGGSPVDPLPFLVGWDADSGRVATPLKASKRSARRARRTRRS